MTIGGRIPNTPIMVDSWYYRDGVRFFFLTHMHADHTAGMNPSWNLGRLFCSPISKQLLIHKFDINPALITELVVGQPFILYLDEGMTESISVTPIDANHCPGAVMFVFEGYFGRILVTGDCRYTPLMMEHEAMHGIFDAMYLDDTFAHPHCLFPSQEEAANQIISIIQSHPDYEVRIGVDTLGKEDLLITIAKACQSLVSVSEERYKTLELLQMEQYFTTDPSEAFIHMVPRWMVSDKRLEQWNKTTPTIGIIPTGWVPSGSDIPPPQECISPLAHYVLYSLHSSFTEIGAFIEAVKPRKIISAVRDRNSDLVQYFGHFLNPTPSPEYTVPEVVKQMMYTRPLMPQGNIKSKKMKRKKNHGIYPIPQRYLPNGNELLLRSLEDINASPVRPKKEAPGSLTIEEMQGLLLHMAQCDDSQESGEEEEEQPDSLPEHPGDGLQHRAVTLQQSSSVSIKQEQASQENGDENDMGQLALLASLIEAEDLDSGFVEENTSLRALLQVSTDAKLSQEHQRLTGTPLRGAKSQPPVPSPRRYPKTFASVTVKQEEQETRPERRERSVSPDSLWLLDLDHNTVNTNLPMAVVKAKSTATTTTATPALTNPLGRLPSAVIPRTHSNATAPVIHQTSRVLPWNARKSLSAVTHAISSHPSSTTARSEVKQHQQHPPHWLSVRRPAGRLEMERVPSSAENSVGIRETSEEICHDDDDDDDVNVNVNAEMEMEQQDMGENGEANDMTGEKGDDGIQVLLDELDSSDSMVISEQQEQQQQKQQGRLKGESSSQSSAVSAEVSSHLIHSSNSSADKENDTEVSVVVGKRRNRGGVMSVNENTTKRVHRVIEEEEEEQGDEASTVSMSNDPAPVPSVSSSSLIAGASSVDSQATASMSLHSSSSTSLQSSTVPRIVFSQRTLMMGYRYFKRQPHR